MPVTLCALLWASVAVATPTRIVALAPHIVEILYAVGAGPEAPLYALVFSPGLYLCGSALHVAHTAWMRGLAPR